MAAANYMIGAAILEEKAPVELGSENGPDSQKTRADIVNFLKPRSPTFIKLSAALMMEILLANKA